MSISHWQAQFNALMRARCVPCHGAGALDNAKIVSTMFSVWTCPTCAGSGFAPQPVENMPPANLPELPEGS
jgi:DnaJ-class molecular chaperone